MSIISINNIKFENIKDDGFIYKIATTPDGLGHPEMNHIMMIKNVSTIEMMILKVDKAINGQFDPDDNNDVSNDEYVAFVTPSGIEFWDIDVQNIIYPLYPLQDFKELLLAWKTFLETPPFHGDKY